MELSYSHFVTSWPGRIFWISPLKLKQHLPEILFLTKGVCKCFEIPRWILMELSSNNLFLCISFYGKIFTCLEKARWNLAVIFHINKIKHSLQLTLYVDSSFGICCYLHNVNLLWGTKSSWSCLVFKGGDLDLSYFWWIKWGKRKISTSRKGSLWYTILPRSDISIS